MYVVLKLLFSCVFFCYLMLQLMLTAVLENLFVVDPILHSAVLVNWPQLAPNYGVSLYCLQHPQGCGESSGAGTADAAAQASPVPYHLLHQSSGTSMTSTTLDQHPSLRQINTRKRASSLAAASPRYTSQPLISLHFCLLSVKVCRPLHCSMIMSCLHW